MDTYKNFARATLSSGIAAGATSATLAAGTGAKFPTTAFSATIWNQTDYASSDLDPNVEIVRVTSRSTDVLTITRGYDNTTDVAHNTGGKTYGVAQVLIADMLNTEIKRFKRVRVTTTATLAVDETFVEYDTSGGAFTVTLPAISAVKIGHEIQFWGYAPSGTAVITLARASSDTIKTGVSGGASTNATTLVFASATAKTRLVAVEAGVWANS